MTTLLQISYNVPVTWLFGTMVAGVFGIARIYAMFKDLINRVDKLEKSEAGRNEKIDQILSDVAYIKGKLESLNK